MQNRLDLSDRRCTDRNIEIELVVANLILAYFPENVNEYNSILYLQMADEEPPCRATTGGFVVLMVVHLEISISFYLLTGIIWERSCTVPRPVLLS